MILTFKYREACELIIFILSVYVLVHNVWCLWYFSARVDDFEVDTWTFRYGEHGTMNKSIAE